MAILSPTRTKTKKKSISSFLLRFQHHLFSYPLLPISFLTSTVNQMPTQKCLYLHPSAGTIQVDVNADYLFPRPNNNNDKAWKLLRDLPESQYGSTRDQQTPPLRRGNVYCALRPELVLDDTIVSRLKMLKMRLVLFFPGPFREHKKKREE